MITEVILVDADDRELGVLEKMSAHRRPAPLHRAVSVFLVDDAGRLLIQQRSEGKYHFAGLWANSCCGHPMPGESVLAAARRRCVDELGVAPLMLREVASFIYQADEPDGELSEHELDHVVLGRIETTPIPDPDEIAALTFLEPGELTQRMTDRPEQFAPWLRPVLEIAITNLPAYCQTRT